MSSTRRPATNPRLGALDRIPTPLPARLAHVRQRRHVRCIVPSAHPLFVEVTPHARAQKPCRTVALDVSLGGLALEVIEPYLSGLPDRGDDVWLAMDLDGAEVMLAAHVMSSSAKKLRVRLACDAQDKIEPRLVMILADVVTFGMRALDRAQVEGLLSHRLGFVRFLGAEHLDMRIHCDGAAGVAPWWQVRFLDYILNWNAQEGLTCVASERREDLAGPLGCPDEATARALIRRLALRGTNALPEHRAAFEFMARTVCESEDPPAASHGKEERSA